MVFSPKLNSLSHFMFPGWPGTNVKRDIESLHIFWGVL